MKKILCIICKNNFTPKPMGYNAKYCSKKCKNKAGRDRLTKNQKQKNRKRSYQSIKNNPERYGKHLSQTKNSKKIIRLWVAQYKQSIGCVDCGYKLHFAALQLDHEGVKSANFSDIRSSKERILKEIKDGNCKVRCANCHSVRTWAIKNNIKYIPKMGWNSIIDKDENQMFPGCIKL